jgi:hypothetical protein
MTSLRYSYFFIIYLSFIRLQIIDTNITQSSNIFASQIIILGALTNVDHIEILNNISIYSTTDLSISSQSFLIHSNPLLTMLELCEIGNISHAKIILAGQPLDEYDYDLTLTAIAYISDFYHIPVITIASRDNILSDNVKMN